MNPSRDLTDDDLELLLRDAFASHEGLADVETAHRIATTPPPPRRMWPAVIGVAAAVAVIAGLGIGVVRGTSSPTITNGPNVVTGGQPFPLDGQKADLPTLPFVVSPAPGAAVGCSPLNPPVGHVPPLTFAESTELATTDVENRAAAGARVDEILNGVSPLLRTSTRNVKRLNAPPTEGLAKPPTSSILSDPSLTKTQWWFVPMKLQATEGYLACNGIDDVRPQVTWSRDNVDHGYLPFAEYQWPSSNAYTSPALTVTLESVSGGTAIRADAFLAARRGRPVGSFITELAPSIDISGLSVESIHVTDPTKVADITTAFDDLAAVARHVAAAICPTVGGSVTPFTVTFHTAQGDIVAREQAGPPDACEAPQLAVTRDGEALTPDLDGTSPTFTGETSGTPFLGRIEEILGVSQ